MDQDVLVKAENVSKKFCRSLTRSLWYGVQDMAGEIVGRGSSHEMLRKDEFWAVADVSFELRRGECLGLIGHNGAGKTTLLRMLNGLIRPDRGRITMRGRVGALIALGAGFNPILSGRENIYANGAVLGMSRQEINKRFDDIVAFADLTDFIDASVQTYSSGMQVRLGFAVATALNPDVLIIDEVLAVGDAAFQSKCFRRIGTLLANDCCIIFVSHQMHHVTRICTAALLMSRGRVVSSGTVGEAIQAYRSIPLNTPPHAAGMAIDAPTAVTLLSVSVASPDSPSVRTIASGAPATFTIEYRCASDVDNVLVTLSITSDFDGTHTHYSTKATAPLTLKAGIGRVALHIPYLGLSAGLWRIAAGIFDAAGVKPYAWNWTAGELLVNESSPMVGRFRFAHSWELDFAKREQPANRLQVVDETPT